MRAQLIAAVRAILVFTVLLGLVYPLVVTGIAQAAFNDEADGSLITRDGEVVGSRLIGQAFDGDEWFHSRPSAAGDGYDAMASSASNLGPTNETLLDNVANGVEAYRAENGLAARHSGARRRGDVVRVGPRPAHLGRQRSTSGAARGGRARSPGRRSSWSSSTTTPSEATFGFLGEDGVNVLELNLALDEAR